MKQFLLYLGESEQDDIVRAWIAEKKRAGESVSGAIKDLIEADHRGHVSNNQLLVALHDINQKIENGQLFVKENADSEPRQVDERLPGLDNFGV